MTHEVEKNGLNWSPVDKSQRLFARDSFGIAAVLRTSRNTVSARTGQPKRDLRARLLAAAVGATHMWTIAFANMVGLPPVPTTAAYRRALRDSIVRAASEGKQIANTAIQCCAASSTIGCSSLEQRRERAEALCSRICMSMDRVPAALAVWDHGLDAIARELKGPGLPEKKVISCLCSFRFSSPSAKHLRVKLMILRSCRLQMAPQPASRGSQQKTPALLRRTKY